MRRRLYLLYARAFCSVFGHYITHQRGAEQYCGTCRRWYPTCGDPTCTEEH